MGVRTPKDRHWVSILSYTFCKVLGMPEQCMEWSRSKFSYIS